MVNPDSITDDVIQRALKNARNRLGVKVTPNAGLHSDLWGQHDRHLSATQFRESVHADVARDLEAVGVSHPFMAWRDACNEIHRAAYAGLRETVKALQETRALIEVKRIYEKRDGTFAPDDKDVREAALRGYKLRVDVRPKIAAVPDLGAEPEKEWSAEAASEAATRAFAEMDAASVVPLFGKQQQAEPAHLQSAEG